MGLFNRKKAEVIRYKFITEAGNGFFSFNGNLYQSDIVRSCIRPFARAVGKLAPKHIRNDVTIDEPYMRMLLQEPNPLMSGQMFQAKMATILALNHNAFAFIQRDENGIPIGIYPIICHSAEAHFNDGNLHLDFQLLNGKSLRANYEDVIHLREDFFTNDIFGENSAKVLLPLMEVVVTMDQGVIKAIKNGAVIRWILKLKQQLRPEDIKRKQREFVESYMDVESDTAIGAAAVDSTMDATQVEPKDYVPNAAQTDRTLERIYSYFNTNKKIIQSSYNEDEWNAYYESVIEPTAIQLSNEYTRKLFTRRERGYGNRIVFDSCLLQYASMKTKVGLVQMVDRGALTPNEWRKVFNLSPLEGGDVPLLRKDTGVRGKEENKDGEED